jgi:pimeloyl-ACP methyl ester carboxylesterase
LAARDATISGMRVEVKGARLWFDVDGSALAADGAAMRERPTVVLLHGGPGSFDHSYFKPDFARLADVAQVVYLDLPGHGRSEWGEPAQWSFELCADAVRDFCDTLVIERPVVYGHSLGGMIALVYGTRHPGHAGALVFQSIFGRFDLERTVDEFRRRGGEEIAEVVRRAYGGEGESVTPEEWAPCWKLFGSWVPEEDERARTVANAELNPHGLELLRRFDVLAELRGIGSPSLVCGGELDPMAPPALLRELHDALPSGSARLEVIDGAGHFTWRDAPDRYWPVLTEFVSTATRVAQTS